MTTPPPDSTESQDAFFRSYSTKLAYQVSSIASCDAEPLSRIGAIQPEGYFIACDTDELKIIACSENFAALLGVPIESVHEKPLSDFLSLTSGDRLEPSTIPQLLRAYGSEMILRGANSKKLIASITRASYHLCVNLEPASPDTDTTLTSGLYLRDVANVLGDFENLHEIAAAAAKYLREITGFDRVMVYRFLESWDGEVIGESKIESVEPYLHLRYPASDIPPQARELYLDSKHRIIFDVESEPVPVQTVRGIARNELDLTCSHLRASSPIHIKYLKNMGVRSSFSVTLKVQGQLWGLFSCHQYSKRAPLTLQQRSACEFVAQIFSARILDFTAKRRLKVKNHILSVNQILLSAVSKGQGPLAAFQTNERDMLSLADASGMFVRFAGQTARLGQCPNDRLIDALLTELKSHESLSLWKTNCLKKDLRLEDIDPTAAGAMAIPLSLGFEDVLIWFRPESYQTIQWGGKPSERENLEGIKTSLEPRSSFKAWSEKIEGCSEPWTDSDEESAKQLIFSFVEGIFAKAAALSNAYRELEKVARAKDEFIGTVSHELRTPLGIIMGWVDIMRDMTDLSEDATQAIGIIDRNARLQIALINDLLDISRIISGQLRIDPRPNIEIEKLITETVESLQPTAQAKSIALRWLSSSTTRVTGDPDRLRQVIYNLLTNALKFTPKGGNVRVEFEKRRSDYQISIIDSGVGINPSEIDSVFDRFVQVGEDSGKRAGLGLGLSIVKALVELHGGRIYAQSAGLGRGTTMRMSLPVYALAPHADDEAIVPTVRPLASEEFKGMHVLVAEDKEDSAKALEILLKRNGATVELAPDGLTALEKLKAGKFDLILSDVGMPDMNGYQLMQAWRSVERERRLPRIPAVALTAYARPKDRALALEAGFNNHIAKPVDRVELIAVIRSVRL